MKLTNNVILITGGTSGIGRALAEAWHKNGNTVIVAGRRQNLLDELTARHSGMTGIAVDLSDSKAIQPFADRIRSEFPNLNVCSTTPASRVRRTTPQIRSTPRTQCRPFRPTSPAWCN